MKYVCAGLLCALIAVSAFAYTLNQQLQSKVVELVRAEERVKNQQEIIRWKTIYVPVRIETKTKEIMERKAGDDECLSALQLLRDFQ